MTQRIATFLVTLGLAFAARAQSTIFTYQGRLMENGAAVMGAQDFEFRVFTAALGGTQTGSLITLDDVGVTNGLFNVPLDFGAVFDGSARFLELKVRPGASTGSYASLSPRQPIIATPYAITAGNLSGALSSASLNGVYGNAVTLNNAANSFSGSGANLTTLNASQLGSGTVPEARLPANVALRGGGNAFTGNQTITGGNVGIGTVAPAATLDVAGAIRADYLQLDPVDGGTEGGELLLKGAATFPDWNMDASGSALRFHTLGGVKLQIDPVGGLSVNGNVALNGMLGTAVNQPLELMAYSERVVRLEPHFISPNVIAGHRLNAVSNGVFGATIAGGGSSDYRNRIAGEYAAVLGGYGNTANGRASTAMGFNTIAGGHFSTAAGADARAIGISSVAMGNTTTASGDYSAALGRENIASGEFSTALGWGTAASALGATALGVATQASGERSTAAGFLSVASGFCSTAIGRGNVAAGEYSFAAGYRAKANRPGSFVWADSIGLDFVSTSDNQFLIRASGGVGIGTPNPQGSLHVYSGNNPTVMRVQSTGTPGFGRLEFVSNPQGDANEWRPAYIQSTDAGGFAGGLSFVVNGTGAANKFGEVETMRIQNGRVGIGTTAPVSELQVVGTVTATAFNPPSDRNLKENFAPVSPREVLDKVTALPISRWNFKGDAATPHVGPMAQDFHAAFSLGTDDKHIATVDADGVALAAIQGLNQKVELETQQKDAEIAELKKLNSELLRRLEAIEARLK